MATPMPFVWFLTKWCKSGPPRNKKAAVVRCRIPALELLGSRPPEAHYRARRGLPVRRPITAQTGLAGTFWLRFRWW
jgi:hypothetical protein